MSRNYSIDALRFVCAVLVVMIHARCAFSDVLRPLARCAVPCFFMISGYLLFDGQAIGTVRLRRNLLNMLKVTAWSTLLFVVLKEALYLHDGKPFVPSAQYWLHFVLFNDAPFEHHLWYLWAYLYVLLIVWAVDRWKAWRWLFAAVPLLLAGNLLIGEWAPLFFGKEQDSIYSRNFLFTGLPFFALGAWLKTQQPRWSCVNRRWFAGGGNFVFVNLPVGKHLPGPRGMEGGVRAVCQ